MRDAVQNGLNTLAVFVPRLIGFLLILVVGIILARLIAKAIGKLLERVGFDRAVERGGVKRALERSKLDASDVVEKLVYYTLLLFVLQLAFSVFGPNPVSDLIERVIAFLPGLIVAIVIVVVAAAIAAVVKSVIESTLGGLSYGKVLAGIASAFILFLGITAALEQVGVATAITTPVLIAILATIGGVIVVGVGGGLVRPMQQRWESYLSKAEAEAPRLREQVRNAPPAREQVREAAERARTRADDRPTYATAAVPAAGQETYAYESEGYQTEGYQPAQGYASEGVRADAYPTQPYETRGSSAGDGYFEDYSGTVGEPEPVVDVRDPLEDPTEDPTRRRR
jgi:ABC-type multidrug transport system fused ATPase/permease subunit